jgi:Bacterial SH3 domain
MRGPLPSAWLLGAALYTALTLFLNRPVSEDWPLPPRTNETVIAKQPHKAAGLVFKDELPKVAAVPSAASKGPWRNEYVQVSEYTTVGRVHPSAASPVLFAYSVGRPLRVIAREDGFVRVQDLGSGQLGWIKQTALTPFTGGYRVRQAPAAEPVVAAAEPEATAQAPQVAAVATPVAAKKVVRQHRKDVVVATQPRPETVAATEPVRGLFRRKRGQIERAAYGSDDDDVAAIMRRAFSRF